MQYTILIISAVFPPEPVVSAMLSLDIAMRLSAMGNKVVVVTPKATRPLNYTFTEEKYCYPFEHIVLDSYTCPESKIIGRTRESISFGNAISRFINNYPHPIDCIYANTWALFSQKSLAKVARKKNIPYIIHVQDVYPESYCVKLPRFIGNMLYNILIPIDRYVHMNAERIIGISPAMIKYLSQSRDVKKEKYVLVRNWQNDKTFIEEYKPIKKSDSQCHLMYLGSINPTANIPLILESLKLIENVPIRLSIIGNGPEKNRCQTIARDSGIEVIFDTVEPQKVALKQRESDVLILCLKKGVANTATPSKLTAYMFSGRPIIACVDLDSDCANIVREAGCGIVVEPENHEELSRAISEMASWTEEQLNEKGLAAFQFAQKHLSKESNLNIITDIICSLSK